MNNTIGATQHSMPANPAEATTLRAHFQTLGSLFCISAISNHLGLRCCQQHSFQFDDASLKALQPRARARRVPFVNRLKLPWFFSLVLIVNTSHLYRRHKPIYCASLQTTPRLFLWGSAR